MATSVTLRQEKVILASGYQVESTIIAATPITMHPVFVVKEGLDPWEEIYESVADLTDLANYVENNLVRITASIAGQFNTISVQVGDVLTVDNALAVVPEWFSTSFLSATFIVASVDASGDFLFVQSSKPFPTAASGLTWTVVTRGSGAGYTSREDASTLTYLRRHFTAVLGNVSQAESRVAAIQTGVQSVVNASNVHGTTFEGTETDTYS